MAPFLTKLERDLTKMEIEQQTDKLLKTSTDTTIDMELKDLGPQLLTKSGDKKFKAFPDADVKVGMQDLGILPNDAENNGDSQSPQAALDEFNISEKPLPDTVDSTWDVNLQPIRQSRHDDHQIHNTCELLTYGFIYVACLLLAFGYAAYYAWMPIVAAILGKSLDSNETLN